MREGMISSDIFFVGVMTILAVLFYMAILFFFEKGEKVYRRLTIRGWNYYRDSFIFIEKISKSNYYQALKEEEEARRKRRELEDKLRNE